MEILENLATGIQQAIATLIPGPIDAAEEAEPTSSPNATNPQDEEPAMSRLGVHFALTDAEVETLRGLEDELERVEFITDEIEEEYFETHPDLVVHSGKAWDAMHRALTDGDLSYDEEDYPLDHVILAGELLYTGSEYILSLKTPQQVADAEEAMQGIDEAEFRTRYFAIGDQLSEYTRLSEQDFEATWKAFQSVREFFARAKDSGRHVLFTADQ